MIQKILCGKFFFYPGGKNMAYPGRVKRVKSTNEGVKSINEGVFFLHGKHYNFTQKGKIAKKRVLPPRNVLGRLELIEKNPA